MADLLNERRDLQPNLPPPPPSSPPAAGNSVRYANIDGGGGRLRYPWMFTLHGGECICAAMRIKVVSRKGVSLKEIEISAAATVKDLKLEFQAASNFSCVISFERGCR